MESIKKIKEEPIIDERLPHPYREVVRELRGIRELLEEINKRLVPVPPAVVVPPVVVKAPPPLIGTVEVSAESIKKIAKHIAELITSRLEMLPNRLDRIDVDTSVTEQISLRAQKKIWPALALGFWVEDVGGGFSYIIVSEKQGDKERTAAVDDKWDMAFANLLITGSGVAGTAKIWLWWIEPESLI